MNLAYWIVDESILRQAALGPARIPDFVDANDSVDSNYSVLVEIVESVAELTQQKFSVRRIFWLKWASIDISDVLETSNKA